MDTAYTITVLSLGLTFISNILLGAIVLLYNIRNKLHQLFFALAIASSVWVATNLLFNIVTDDTLQYAIALASYGSAAILGLFFLLYSLRLANVKLNSLVAAVIWIVGIFTALVSMIPGVLNTDVVDDKIVVNGPFNVMYGFYLFVFMGAGIAILFHEWSRAKGSERGKIAIVLLGLMFAAILGLFFNLVLPMAGNYDFVDIGPVATFILAGSSTYAIARHRLFDIKFAAVRTITYVGTLFTLTITYCIAVYAVSTVVMGGSGVANAVVIDPLSIVLALLLAFLFQPIKKFYDKLTKNIFYRDAYGSSEFFGEISRLLTSTTELRGLLERASEHIAVTFKAEQVFFFLHYKNSKEHHISAGTKRHSRMPVLDARMLDAYVQENPGDFVVADLLPDDSTVRRMLKSHNIGLAMPLGRGDTMTGYLLLGNHRTGSYTKRDLEVLQAVNNEFVIAIQNALSLHEVRELNATLQQRIDVATKELRASNAQLKHIDEVKDEFMSMASHQLRTPLTSIKGYLSMVLDGDMGKVTPQQEQVLQEAFNSSERMVHLIADFLNVSRLQTGKFVIEKSIIDFNSLVEKEIDDLRVMAKGHRLELVLKLPGTKYLVNADAAKLREVVTNFVDNAIFYSRPGSKIAIRVKQDGDSLVFTVTDTGIGVPKSEQARIFGKFFRATNARRQRPDGTGVGLYLAHKVITAHGGKVLFESIEGKGSIFGFRMPLAHLPNQPNDANDH